MLDLDECPLCGGEMELFDSGMFKGFKWVHLKCIECKYEESDEPDYDSLPGGRDDY